MPYRSEICKAGKTKQYTYYYSIRSDKKEGSRRKKVNKTSEAQKRVNSRLAIKELTWRMNANFDETCLYITYSYAKENRPQTKEEIKKDMENLLKKIRRQMKKEGREAKYIWVAEVGQRGAAHIHMCLNNINIQVLKRMWTKGWVTIKPMDESGQYAKLASYFVKYSEKTMKTVNGFNGKRYNSSKNLVIPQPERKNISARNCYSHNIVIPSGWYLDKDSVREAWHEVTGFMYFTYTLIYNGLSRKNKSRSTYTLDLDTGEVKIIETLQKERG